MTILTTSHSVRCATNKQTRVAISCSICAVSQRKRTRHGTPVWVSGPICLDSSFRFAENWRGTPPSLRLRKTCCGSCRGIRHGTIPADWFGSTVVLSSPHGQRRWLEHWYLWNERKPSESIRSYRRNGARHPKPKRRSILHMIRTECCESIFLRLPEVSGRKYYFLIWKNLRAETSGTRGRRGRRNRDSTGTVRTGKTGALPTVS